MLHILVRLFIRDPAAEKAAEKASKAALKAAAKAKSAKSTTITDNTAAEKKQNESKSNQNTTITAVSGNNTTVNSLIFPIDILESSTVYQLKLLIQQQLINQQKTFTDITVVIKGRIVPNIIRLVDLNLVNNQLINAVAFEASISTSKPPSAATTTASSTNINTAESQAAAASAASRQSAAESAATESMLTNLHSLVTPERLQPLLDMGFDPIRSVKALLINMLQTELAVEWLFEHSEDQDIDVPLSRSQLSYIARAFGLFNIPALLNASSAAGSAVAGGNIVLSTSRNADGNIVVTLPAPAALAAASSPLVSAAPSHSTLTAAEVESVMARDLCSFTITGRQFAPQNYYYCYTCDLADSRGCCEACVRVCHANHEISELIESESFFCDCGAGEGSNPCKGLVPQPTPAELAVIESAKREAAEAADAIAKGKPIPHRMKQFPDIITINSFDPYDFLTKCRPVIFDSVNQLNQLDQLLSNDSEIDISALHSLYSQLEHYIEEELYNKSNLTNNTILDTAELIELQTILITAANNNSNNNINRLALLQLIELLVLHSQGIEFLFQSSPAATVTATPATANKLLDTIINIFNSNSSTNNEKASILRIFINSTSNPNNYLLIESQLSTLINIVSTWIHSDNDSINIDISLRKFYNQLLYNIGLLLYSSSYSNNSNTIIISINTVLIKQLLTVLIDYLRIINWTSTINNLESEIGRINLITIILLLNINITVQTPSTESILYYSLNLHLLTIIEPILPLKIEQLNIYSNLITQIFKYI